MRKMVLVVGVMMSTGVAAADRWFVIDTDTLGGEVSIDMETYKAGTFPEFWVQFSKVECGAKNSWRGCSVKGKSKVNCKSRELASLRTMHYDENGTMTYDTGLQKAAFEEPIPGSVGEAVVEFVCPK